MESRGPQGSEASLHFFTTAENGLCYFSITVRSGDNMIEGCLTFDDASHFEPKGCYVSACISRCRIIMRTR